MRAQLSILVLLTILYTGCTRIVYITEKVKPEIELQSKHNSVCFVNLFDYTSPSVVTRKDFRPYYYGVKGLTMGLQVFETDTSFAFTVADSLYKGVDKSELTALLSADLISSFCRKTESNYLIVLDSLSLYFDRETVVSNDYGMERRSWHFYLNGSFFITLYNSDGNYINRSRIDESRLYGIVAARADAKEVLPPLQGTEGDIIALATQAANDYYQKFRPGISTFKEELYRGQTFSKSNSLIYSKKWEQAIEILEQLARSNDEDIAVKARHNLRIARKAAAASSQ